MVRCAHLITVSGLVASLVVGPVAFAQSGSGSFQSRLTLQSGGENAALTTHRDALNRPCLEIEAVSRRHVINPNVFDHVVSVSNRCLKLIKLRVCYSKSDSCIDMEVPGQQRKEGILGIYPNMQYFRYSFREKF